MELADILHQMIQQNQQANQPTDLRIGTVTGTVPLEITINPAMAPLRGSVLYLTAAVVEKKIPALGHSHSYTGGTTGAALESVVCLENGKPLPVKDGYIILNRALAKGDKVLLLRVQQGQKFIVLSRIFEEG